MVLPPFYPFAESMACPTLAITSQHDVVVGFSAASQLQCLSIYMVGRRSYDPINTLPRGRLVVEGEADLFPSPPGYVVRFDYCQAVTLPDGHTTSSALN